MSVLPECDLRCGKNMDRCAKWDRRNKCVPTTLETFDSNVFQQCEIDQVCRKSSIFGNDFLFLTDEDIEALKNGKVLYVIDEYGTFLAYKKGETK